MFEHIGVEEGGVLVSVIPLVEVKELARSPISGFGTRACQEAGTCSVAFEVVAGDVGGSGSLETSDAVFVVAVRIVWEVESVT